MKVLIIDVMREDSFYRLKNIMSDNFKNAAVIITVHVLKNMQKIENIFCISSIAQIRKGYLYPNQANLYFAKKLPKRYSPKSKRTVAISVDMWIRNNKVTVITDSREVENGIKMQNLDSDLKVIRI